MTAACRRLRVGTDISLSAPNIVIAPLAARGRYPSGTATQPGFAM
jgi:hypothetical protein